MADKLRQDLPFSTDINAYTTTEPNHAETFNQRANQFASNDAYLKGEQDKIKQSMAEGLPANGGNSDTVDGCHAGTTAGNVLKLTERGKVIDSALINAIKKWWLPSTSYAKGEIVVPLEFMQQFIFVCTIAGQTSSTPPIWEAIDGKIIQDGAATWTAVDLRNALTVGGHTAGTAASNVLVLDSAAKVPLSVLSFIQNSKIAENFLTAAAKRWWKSNTSYAKGDIIQPLSALQGQVYECVQAGTTSTTEPAWPSDILSEFTDGTVKWRTRSALAGAYITEFRNFYEQTPPQGWVVRNGALLANADTTCPALWAELQKPTQAWKLKTEDEWQAMSALEPWNGVGGVPYFVLDLTAKTIRLPDTRGMYEETAGFDGLDVGGVHGDAIRGFTGTFPIAPTTQWGVVNGVFKTITWGSGDVKSQSNNGIGVFFDPALQVPTANKNQPRAFGTLGCVYIGQGGSN